MATAIDTAIRTSPLVIESPTPPVTGHSTKGLFNVAYGLSGGIRPAGGLHSKSAE